MYAKFGLYMGILFLIIIPWVHAEQEQIIFTDKGSLKVSLITIPDNPMPGDQSKLKIEFINPQNNRIQEHIDYWVTVYIDDETTFGPIPRTHTSSGSVTIPVSFPENGEYIVLVKLDGILFVPIPVETASFNLEIDTLTNNIKEVIEIPDWIRNNALWWSDGLIEDRDFLSGIEFLLEKEIMKIPKTESNSEPSVPFVPNWIKDTVGWWATGKVKDKDFVNGIQWLIENGIIRV